MVMVNSSFFYTILDPDRVYTTIDRALREARHSSEAYANPVFDQGKIEGKRYRVTVVVEEDTELV